MEPRLQQLDQHGYHHRRQQSRNDVPPLSRVLRLSSELTRAALYIDQYAGDAVTMPMIEFGSNAYVQAGSGANSSLFGNLNDAPQFYRNADIRGDVTHIQGTHTIRAGAEWRQQHFARGIQGNSSGILNFDTTFVQQNDGTNKDCTATNCNLGVPGASNYGLSYAALLMGVPTTSTVNKQAPVSISTPYYNFYIGDTWRVTPKLTIIPGSGLSMNTARLKSTTTRSHDSISISNWRSPALPVRPTQRCGLAQRLPNKRRCPLPSTFRAVLFMPG